MERRRVLAGLRPHGLSLASRCSGGKEALEDPRETSARRDAHAATRAGAEAGCAGQTPAAKGPVCVCCGSDWLENLAPPSQPIGIELVDRSYAHQFHPAFDLVLQYVENMLDTGLSGRRQGIEVEATA